MKATEQMVSKQHGLLPIMGKLQNEALCECIHLEVSEVEGSRSYLKSNQAELRPSMFNHGCLFVQDNKSTCLKEPHDIDNKFALLLRHHGKAKRLFEGHCVHAQITMLGYDHRTFLANCLIDMYGNCGKIEDAQTVFEKITHPNVYSFNIVLKTYGQNEMLDAAREIFWGMPLRDVVSWSTMIAALSQWGHYEEALDVYSRMALGIIEPDRITFVCILNACSNLALLEKGIEVHASIVAQSLESNIVVATALINMYGKCGRLLYAANVFNHMPTRDTVCWNAMMTTYAQNGNCQEAYFLFKKMLIEGINPTNVSFLCAVDACAGLCVLQEGKRIHAVINNGGVVQDLALGNTLLNMYGKCGSVYLAGFVFESMPSRDIVSWNAMVTVLSQNEKNYEALCLYDDMQVAGIRPNNITFVSALNACASLQALEGGYTIHNTILVDCDGVDIMVESALVNMYGKCSDIHSATKLFSEMVLQDVVSWNVMITSLIHNKHSANAFECFQFMLTNGILPDDITYMSVLDVCASLEDLHRGQQIHATLNYVGYQQNNYVQTSLVNMYGKCGNLCKAKSALDSFSVPNLAALNAYLAVLTENGHGKDALDLFHNMRLHGLKPDIISVVCAIDACAILAAFEDGKEIHDAIVDLEYEQDLVVRTALINMYGKCGSLRHSRIVFEKMQQWDLILCNAMICVFAQYGHAKEAFCVFFQMQQDKIKPDQVTFISILTACSHTGQIEEGRHLFVSISRDHRLKQLEDHYVCMIDILGRAGLLDEAEELINSIPFEKSALVWLTLLSACQMHSDMERGCLATNKCFEIDPENAAPYVLMSNIYVAAGSWVGTARELQLKNAFIV
eukprot:c24888_g1_i1 orf=525-3071(-)